MNLRLTPIALFLSTLSLAVSGSLYAAGGTGGGGGGGGGGTACDTSSVLPTTAPEADIIMRESFGMGPNNSRPTGGKGCNKPDFVHTPLTGFWVEYPGSKNATWLTAPETGQTWRFCAQSQDPNELPSPLQIVTATGDLMNGCVASDWFDPAQIAGEFPTAIIPFTAPAGAYEASIDGWPAPLAGMYVAIGFTNSTLTVNNLQSTAGVWLLVKQGPALDNLNLVYEFRADGMTGPLLATGQFFSVNFNQIAVRYDPPTRMAGASINGMDLGSYPVTLPGTPKFIGFEGVGILDNFVVRQR
jgi:hypothetical protein